MSKIRFETLLTAAWLMIAVTASALAQQTNGCVKEERTGPPRVVYQCANGLVFEAEAAALIEINSSAGQARPTIIQLNEDAVLIEVEPGSGPFQILTPHAIAAVRGTIFVVDVTAETTEVFVVRGRVEVSRPDGTDPVMLTEGEGVTVADGTPLTVKQWPPEKVEKLLARFAR